METAIDYSGMTLRQIAGVVYRDWGGKVNYAAKPYLEAMSTLDSIEDPYYDDDGAEIVGYFLANATTWRGEVARAVKKELNKRHKAYYASRGIKY